MRSGRINLYDWNDKLISSLYYISLPTRKRAIEVWKKRYRDKIKDCYFQIRPNVSAMRTRGNGENKYKSYSLKPVKSNIP